MMQDFRQKYKVTTSEIVKNELTKSEPNLNRKLPEEKTSEENEILDYYDKNHKKQGTIKREEAIQKGLLLEAVQLWIININTQEVLLQRRSNKKKHAPYKIDTSCSGHVNPKETHIQAMLREAREEIGIMPENLAPNMQYLTSTHIDLSKHGSQGNYILYSYLAFNNYPLEYYKIQEEEVDHLFFMKYEDVKNMIVSEDTECRIPYDEQTKKILQKIDEKIEKYKEENKEKSKKESK